MIGPAPCVVEHKTEEYCAEEYWLITDCLKLGLYLNNRSWTGQPADPQYEH